MTEKSRQIFGCKPVEAGLGAEQLKSAAEIIRRALAGLATRASISMDELEPAFTVVRRISEIRASLAECPAQSDSDPAFQTALTEYRGALREWAGHLPRVRGWLLAERHRLDSRRKHGRSVREWLNSRQQTL